MPRKKSGPVTGFVKMDAPEVTAWNGAPRCRFYKTGPAEDLGDPRTPERCKRPVKKDEYGNYAPTCATHARFLDDGALVRLPTRVVEGAPPKAGSIFGKLRLAATDKIGRDLRRNTALLRARLAQLVDRLERLNQEHDATLADVREALDQMKAANLADDGDGRSTALEMMMRAVSSIEDETEAWRGVIKVVGELTRSSDAELKRLKDVGGVVTRKEAAKLPQRLSNILAGVPEENRPALVAVREAVAAAQRGEIVSAERTSALLVRVGMPLDGLSAEALSYIDDGGPLSMRALHGYSDLLWLRVESLLERLPSEGQVNGVSFNDLLGGLRLFRRGHSRGEVWARAAALERIDYAISNAERIESALWDDLLFVLQAQRSVLSAAARCQAFEAKYVLVEDLMSMIGLLLSAVDEHLPGDVAADVRTEVLRLVGAAALAAQQESAA